MKTSVHAVGAILVIARAGSVSDAVSPRANTYLPSTPQGPTPPVNSEFGIRSSEFGVERIVKDMRIGRTQHSLPLARGGGREALGGDCCAGFDAAYPLSRGSDSSPFQKGSQKNAAPFAGARPRAPRRPANMHAFWLRRRGDPCGRPRGTILVCRALWRIREETGILSLCLSKEKEAKRNDTREGKIAISSPPETHPN